MSDTMLILMEYPGLINNQLVHGFEPTDCFVSCPVEKKSHDVAVVRFGDEIAVGAVEPDEPLLVEQGGEDFFVTLILGNSGHFQDIR